MTLAGQVAVMFLLIGVGIYMKKSGVITEEAARQFASFVLLAVTPALMVNTMQREYQPELLPAMGAMLLFTVAFHVLAAVVTKYCFPARADREDRVERMGAACSNCGFMGIPLMSAVMGERGALYAGIYIAVFNVYVWTHGVSILAGKGKLSLKKAVLNPGVISAAIGVALFFMQIRLPHILGSTLSYMAGMNTPLPMVLTGIFIADVPVRRLLRDKKLYWASFVRLLGLPLLFLALLYILRVSHWFANAQEVGLAVMISCSCAAAISCTMMPARFGGGEKRGGELIAMSTLFSIVTIPFVAALAQWVLSF